MPPRSTRLALYILPPVLLLLVAIFSASAQGGEAGDPDPTFAGFAGDGRIDIDDMEVLELAQHGGGWVVLGRRTEELLVRRFTRNGELDRDFGQNGTAVFKTKGNPCSFYVISFMEGCGVAVQSSRGIIVAGATDVGGDMDFLVYRLLPDGRLDTDFGQNGSRTIDFFDRDDRAYAVAIDEDNFIVVVGEAVEPDTANPDDTRFAAARLTPTGGLDDSFGNGGKATAKFEGGLFTQESRAMAVAIQPNGYIVVAGEADYSSAVGGSTNKDFGLLRYDRDGKLDKGGFSGDGKVHTGFNGDLDWANALYIQPDGRIVAAGVKDLDEGIALARYLPNGSDDDSFSNNGKLTTPIGSWSKAVAVTGQPDGKLLALGISDGGTVLARYLTDGTPDSTFSDDGQRLMYAPQEGRDLHLQADGQLLVAAGTFADGSSLTRYQTNMVSLDKAGTNTTGFGYGHDRGQAVAVLPGGGYLVAAEVTSTLINGLDVGLVRYGRNGRLIRDFGLNGHAVAGLRNDDHARAMTVLPDGKILVAGFREVTVNEDFAVWKFNADGSPDSSFGDRRGYALASFGIGPDYAQDMVVQQDGRIVLAGFSENNDGRFLTMVRLDDDGQLDKSFADKGKFVNSQVGSTYFSLRALEELPDGDLLAVGGLDGDFWACRWTADGQLVPGFGNQGCMIYALSGNDEAHDIGVLSSGVILIGGYSGGDFALLFINEDGSMCLARCDFSAFPGADSRIKVDMGGDEVAYQLALQSDGKIILAGSKRTMGPEPGPWYVARIHRRTFPTAGYGLDTSFSGNGKAGLAFILGSRLQGIALDGDKIVLAGFTQNGADDDIALARLLNDHTQPPPPNPSTFMLPLVLGG